MNLSYRGVQYEAAPKTVSTVSSKLIGKYRGAQFSFRVAERSPSELGNHRLTYRGNAYQAHF